MIHVDTTFLVDLLREARRSRSAGATRLLESLGSEALGVSVHAVCELEAGAELSRDPALERTRLGELLSEVEIAYPGPGFAALYARLLAPLEKAGQRIGTMDLLIATAAVAAQASLVTRNVEEFRRVAGLRVIAY